VSIRNPKKLVFTVRIAQREHQQQKTPSQLARGSLLGDRLRLLALALGLYRLQRDDHLSKVCPMDRHFTLCHFGTLGNTITPSVFVVDEVVIRWIALGIIVIETITNNGFIN
jgi:hypothetical protein